MEIVPKGSLIASATSDYDLLLNSPLQNTGETNGQVVMGDEIASVEPLFSGTEARNQRFFKYEDDIYMDGENDRELLISMRHIYVYNKIINEVGESTGGTEQQKKSIEAEARGGRAWTNFLLIQYYGKPYNEATAASDPGFPIITKADVTETKFTRASVKEMYDFILSDLTTAIPNLPAQTTHRYRMSKAAAEALLAKVYLFMGKFNEALPLLNAAFADLANATIPVRLYDYNVTFATGGAFLPLTANGPSFPGTNHHLNEEVVYVKTMIDQWQLASSEFVISPATVALYNSSDQRLKLFSDKAVGSSTAYPNGMRRRIGGTNAPQFGIVMPDLYLLRAETKARLNDLAGAKADVEALRIKRMPAANASVSAAIASNQQDLVKFILEERIREFAVQGFRWFDMRRLSVDPLYNSTIKNTHTVYAANGSVAQTFTLKPERYVLRFSPKIMEQNPGMPNNQ